ncbi:kinesin-like protein KIF21B [Nilaparvata lugens]|uniref:kinesin-like protein KIF21B n=1 Tax=Nilaparvata lugens TaxID=108931 RepID=UPI00193E40D0|nr:kinesin-like protein KIF21B [Nilaparvata lugens]
MAASSPKIAKQKWTALEKNISTNTLNKQSIVALERDMERLINERKARHLELESKLRRLNDLQVSHPREYQLHADLEEEIESLRANLQYIQESIQDSQQNILQVEESKVIINLCGISTEVLLEREAETQRTLLEHIVGKQGDLLTGSVQVESTPSSDSSRSNSPTAADTINGNGFGMTGSMTGSMTRSQEGGTKYRKHTAMAEEMLYANSGGGHKQHPTSAPLTLLPPNSCLRPPVR